MPIDPKKMADLKKRYGKNDGERVYYALETMAKKRRKKK